MEGAEKSIRGPEGSSTGLDNLNTLEKTDWKDEQTPRDKQDHHKGPMYISLESPTVRTKCEAEKLHKERMGEIQIWQKQQQRQLINLQIQDAEHTPNKINPKKSTPKHIIIKLLTIKDKEKNLDVAREKKRIYWRQKTIKKTADLSPETMEAREKWLNISQVPNEKKQNSVSHKNIPQKGRGNHSSLKWRKTRIHPEQTYPKEMAKELSTWKIT